jgi:hypothetical protein
MIEKCLQVTTSSWKILRQNITISNVYSSIVLKGINHSRKMPEYKIITICIGYRIYMHLRIQSLLHLKDTLINCHIFLTMTRRRIQAVILAKIALAAKLTIAVLDRLMDELTDWFHNTSLASYRVRYILDINFTVILPCELIKTTRVSLSDKHTCSELPKPILP